MKLRVYEAPMSKRKGTIEPSIQNVERKGTIEPYIQNVERKGTIEPSIQNVAIKEMGISSLVGLKLF